MANEKMEIDVIVNGQKAKVELDKVAQATDNVGKETEKSAKTMKANWVAIGAAVLAAGAAMKKTVDMAFDLEKATFGLNKETKRYIELASEYYGMNQEIVAGFVQTGKAAGMSGMEIQKMIDMAVALGRAFPHESTETFIDNLSMLNRTGEAQGYIVDILEQKYGAVDLKTISLSDKMKTLEERTKGVNQEFKKTTASQIETTLQEARNETAKFGAMLYELAKESGALWIANKAMTALSLSANGYAQSLALIRKYTSSDPLKVADAQADLERLGKASDELFNKLFGVGQEAPKDALFEVKNGEIVMKPIIVEPTGLQGKPLEQKVIEENLKATQEAEAEKKKATQEAEREKQRAIQETMNMQEMYINELSDGITKMVMDGKFQFKDMLRQWIADLIQSKIATYLKSLLGFGTGGGIIGSITSFLGFHTGGKVSYHTGGHVPSYHSGMRTDERMAKLQVGEAVINRAGARNNAQAIDAMNRGEKVGGGSNVTTAEITFNVTAIDSNSFNSYLVNNRSTIEGIINKSLTTNGSVRQTIKQVV